MNIVGVGDTIDRLGRYTSKMTSISIESICPFLIYKYNDKFVVAFFLQQRKM